jgi:hypothetical protein
MDRDEERSQPVLGNDMNQCMMCKHLVKMGVHFNSGSEGWRCAAFGDRDIPDLIVMGFYDHRMSTPSILGPDGDNGITFEQAEGWPVPYEVLAGPLEE